MRRIENSLIKSTTQDLEKMTIDSKGNKKGDKNKMDIDSKKENSVQKSKEEIEKIKENDRKRIR